MPRNLFSTARSPKREFTVTVAPSGLVSVGQLAEAVGKSRSAQVDLDPTAQRRMHDKSLGTRAQSDRPFVVVLRPEISLHFTCTALKKRSSHENPP